MTTARPGTTKEELKGLAQRLQVTPSQPLDFPLRKDLPSIKDVHYEAAKQPRQVRLDTVAACSAACSWCFGFSATENQHRDGELMPFAMIAKLVDEIATWPEPLYELVPVNYGEFFLRRDWFQILLYIADKLPQTRIWIPTNGSVLTPQFVERLAGIKTLAGLNFSVNAFFQEEYVKTMRLPPWVMKRCEDAMEEIHKLKPSLTLWASMVYNPVLLTELERDLFEDKWRKKGYVTPQILRMTSWNGMKLSHPVAPVTLPCRSIYTDCVIGVNSRVTSCCFDPHLSIDLGDVQKDTILNIWNGTKFNAFRKIHDERKRAAIPICKGCTFS